MSMSFGNNSINCLLLIIFLCITIPKFSLSQKQDYAYERAYGKTITLEADTITYKNFVLKGENYKIFKTLVNSGYTELIFPQILKDGKWIAFFKEDSTKIASIVNYENNALSGWATTFYFNGIPKKKYKYRNGQINGVYYSYCPNGQKNSRIKYKNGVLIEKASKVWDAEGKSYDKYFQK